MTDSAAVLALPSAEDDLPLVTVITPAYNRAGLVEATIQSVLSQDYPNFEYIVLDDGSTDGTLAAIRNFERSLRWASHENVGETLTVNRGFELARGEIIGVVNSDDPLLPGAIRAAAEALIVDPEVLVVYPDWDVIDEQGKFIHHVPTFDYSYVNMVKWHYCVPGPGTFFRRSVVERLGGRDRSFRYVADYDFWLRAGLLGPFRRVPRTLATFRYHPGSASSHPRGDAMAREHIRVIDHLYARTDLPSEILAVRGEAYRNAFFTAAIVTECEVPIDHQRYRWRDTLVERLVSAYAEEPDETITRLHGEVIRLHQAVAKRDRVLAPLGVLALNRLIRRLRAAPARLRGEG